MPDGCRSKPRLSPTTALVTVILITMILVTVTLATMILATTSEWLLQRKSADARGRLRRWPRQLPQPTGHRPGGCALRWNHLQSSRQDQPMSALDRAIIRALHRPASAADKATASLRPEKLAADSCWQSAAERAATGSAVPRSRRRWPILNVVRAASTSAQSARACNSHLDFHRRAAGRSSAAGAAAKSAAARDIRQDGQATGEEAPDRLQRSTPLTTSVVDCGQSGCRASPSRAAAGPKCHGWVGGGRECLASSLAGRSGCLAGHP